MKIARTPISSSPLPPLLNDHTASTPSRTAITSPAYPAALAPVLSDPDARQTRDLTTPPPSSGAPGSRLSMPSSPFVQAKAPRSSDVLPVVDSASTQHRPARSSVDTGPMTAITSSGQGRLVRRSYTV